MIRSVLALSAVLLFALAPASAQGLSATQTVKKMIETTNEAGETTIELVDADLVAPGDTVVYALNYTNGGDMPAEAVTLTMPVPGEVSLIERSANVEGTQVVYSADGGETFSSRGDLTLSVDGQERNAIAADITHVRWTFTDAIGPGESGSVSFRAVLN